MINFKDAALNFLDMLESIAKSSTKVADNEPAPGDPENAPLTDSEALKYAARRVRTSFEALNPESEYDYEKLLELISSAFIIGSRGTISATVRQAVAREPKPKRIPAEDVARAMREISVSKGIPIKAGLKYIQLHYQKDVARKLNVDPVNPRNLSVSKLRAIASQIKKEQI